jgi:hypothetical protein
VTHRVASLPADGAATEENMSKIMRLRVDITVHGRDLSAGTEVEVIGSGGDPADHQLGCMAEGVPIFLCAEAHLEQVPENKGENNG